MEGSSRKSKMPSATPKDQPSRKYLRKGVNPVRSPQVGLSVDNGHPSSLICKNSACQAIISINDRFCRRCSCHFCKNFDDNKDPSLWFVCTAEDGDVNSCGLSCHLKCAFPSKQVGVADLESSMSLDGSYRCECGKVSSILGCWKRQLTIAKYSRHIEVLRERISLSHRLLEGTRKFKELHEIIQEAKGKLEKVSGASEKEVDPNSELSEKMPSKEKMPRKGGIVAREPVAVEVQKLCALAIQRADEILSACRFIFEEITASCIAIVLVDPPAASDLEGFKLWYCKSIDETYSDEPNHIFPKTRIRVLIPNLQPSTEYSFRLASYTKVGDVGLFEARCSTKSELLKNKPTSSDSKATILDLNVAFVPDENEELIPPCDTSAGEYCRQPATGVSTNGKAPAVSSRGLPEKRAAITKDKTTENKSTSLDDKFDDCVKLIRKLECDGHISGEFRKKFLTWFGLRSTEKEKRVVYAFIEAFSDSPRCFVDQLVDTFAFLDNC